MPQVKVYCERAELERHRGELSDVIHHCMMTALGLPAAKRFQRFFALQPEDFIRPEERSARYVILEISMFEGRSVATKKRLVRLLFERFEAVLGILPEDVEVTIFETPRHNWGIRGMPGDELELNYAVDV